MERGHTGCIEEGTGNAVIVGHSRRLKKRSRPCPAAHHSRSYQTRFHRASSSRKHLTGLDFIVVPNIGMSTTVFKTNKAKGSSYISPFECPGDKHHTEREGEAHSQNDAIPEARG
jgi:hypothetical protein